MSSKKWVAAVLAVVVASPFAVAALDAIGIGPNWEVDVAEWESGYSWTYGSNLHVVMRGSFMDESHSMDLKAEGDHVFTVANTTAQHGNVSLYALVEQFVPKKLSEGGEVIYEQEVQGSPEPVLEPTATPQLCLAQCVGEHSFFTKENLNPYYVDTRIHGMHDEEVEIRFLEFPLKSGASWTVLRTDYPIGLPGVDDPYEELVAKVTGRDHVNLPGVGSMEAVRIEAGLTQASKESFQRAFDQLPAQAGKIELDMEYTMTYWYAPEAKNIVRSDVHQSQEFSAEFEGDRMRMDFSMESSSILSDYSLQALPERSVEETNKLQKYVKDLPDVTELSNQSWPFSLAADHYSVDVVKGESVNLGVLEGDRRGETTATLFDEIPSDMKMQWRHRYMDLDAEPQDDWIDGLDYSPRVDWYSGSTLQLAPQSQGLHEITAYLLDAEGRLVALDSAVIEGYAQWVQEDSGYQGLPVGILLESSQRLGFAANIFMDHVLVEVSPGQLGSGNLILNGIYEDGEMVSEGKMVSGSDSIRVDSTQPTGVSSWQARYDDQVRIGALEMTITVRYDRSANFSDASSMWEQNRETADVADLLGSDCALVFASCVFDSMLARLLGPGELHTNARVSGPLS